ncbi:MAG: hypothetical protein ACTSPB_00700 [Candidatus Thorarchaeota archaeon]
MDTASMMEYAWLIIPIMGVKMIVNFFVNRREAKRLANPSMEDVPRDAMERLKKTELHIARSQPKEVWRKIIFSGDATSRGMVLGYTNVSVQTNSMYTVFYRLKWWRFWEEYKFFYVEPEMCGDMNGDELLIKGRSLTAYDEHSLFIEPVYKTKNPSQIYVNRTRWMTARILKLTDFDIKNDIDFILKVAMRGDIRSARNEFCEGL